MRILKEIKEKDEFIKENETDEFSLGFLDDLEKKETNKLKK